MVNGISKAVLSIRRQVKFSRSGSRRTVNGRPRCTISNKNASYTNQQEAQLSLTDPLDSLCQFTYCCRPTQISCR